MQGKQKIVLQVFRELAVMEREEKKKEAKPA